MKIDLFDHNKTAYEAAAELLDREGKAAIVHPTGTGKSFIGFQLCADHPDENVLWLSPSKYIFETQLENLARTTDGELPDNITFLTYARLMMMDEAEVEELKPAWIILDEFHCCGARMWGQGVQRLLQKYPKVPVLGLSATNIRYLDNQRDMAAELFDGNIASEITLGDAIVRGILNPPKYVLSIYKYQQDLQRYYNLSGLMIIIMIILLYRGLVNDRLVYIFFAGLAAGINAFVRLPNILFFAAALCIIWYGVCIHKCKKDIAYQFGIAVLGAVVSLAVTFFIMMLVMGWNQVAESFSEYINLALGQPSSAVENFLGIEEESGHSLYAELRTIVYQGCKSVAVFGLVVCLPVFASLLIKKIFAKADKKELGGKIGFVSLFAGCLFITLFLFIKYSITSVPSWMRGLLSVLFCIILLFDWKNEKPEHNLLYLINVILSFCSIWGSDGGLSRFSILGSFQTAVMLLCAKRFYEKAELSNYPIKRVAPEIKVCVIEMTGTILLFSILIGSFTLPIVYNDSNVNLLTYSVTEELSLFWGMKTSETRADQINQYYELMANEKLIDKEVAIFGYWPLGEVIGSQTSYFENVNPCIDYTSVDVVSLLEVIEKKEREGTVPVIVVSMVDAIQKEMETANISNAKQAVLEYMLSLHEYEVFAETEYFTIYIAAE